MKTSLRAVAGCLALVLVTLGAVGEEVAPASGLDRLAWMAGHWEGEADGTAMEEVWLAPAGGRMVGLHRDVFPSGKSFFEFLRIEEVDGRLAYLASPRGREATVFPLQELGDHRVVFENPGHDFPQRILYWLDGDRLHARIEGEEGGEKKSSEWSWVRRRR